MKLTNARIAAGAAALALAFLGGIALAPALVSTAAAQIGGNLTAPVAENRGGPGVDVFNAAAAYIGITTDQLRTEMGTDKSMADVAVAHGKTRDGLVAALVAAETANLNTRIGELVDRKGMPQHPGPGVRAGVMIKVDLLQTASAYLGISTTELQTQLRAGKTLGEIAAATAGKTKDGLVAAIVAAETAQIDKAVTDGKLTADQATKLKTSLSERVTQMVDRSGLRGAPGFDFRFGFGPRGGRP